ncbi:MAG TPA: choice-of-anchor D domain-containing protein [Terracidiphilus sp.]
MKRSLLMAIHGCLALCLFLPYALDAQEAAVSRADETDAVIVPSRVVDRIDESQLTTLKGNTHPLARVQFDRGPVASAKMLERMILVLKRSPQQEAALAAFNERQYDPSSPDFHHWLTPEQFGRLYGPSDSDMTAITSWLQNRGFRIDNVSPGRINIEFTGTVEQVQSAFHVQMRNYQYKNEMHIANDRDPQIPQALGPVVVGVASLHNFFPKPQYVLGPKVKRDPKTGLVTRLEPQAAPPSGGSVQFTYTDTGGSIHEDVGPYDFATIYNELPLWNAATPINGAGVTIAISGASDVAAVDYTAFRAYFGLPTRALTVIHNGTDPGFDTNGGQGENTLDVEWSGASAPGATIALVVSGSTATTFGGTLSVNYIVQHAVAPIASASYGICELGAGTAGNTAMNTMWQQAATQGISGFVSSGDQGSAGCTSQDGTPPYADQFGLQVNAWASNPFVTGVGGTDLNWQWWTANGWQTYFNANNNATHENTAKAYVPEVPWNSTCTSTILLKDVFTDSNNQPFPSSEALCNAILNDPNQQFLNLIAIGAGSGGVSHCTTSDGNTPSSCTGGYAKPSWQVAPGVPADGKRDVPDVSLFASGGIPYGAGSAYLFCLGGTTGTAAGCNLQEVGGTSASSPAMAGVMALVVQKQGAKQGLANPALYKLAAGENAANCASGTATLGDGCVFNDITLGTIAQVCVTGDTNCTTNTSGDQVGVLSGYSTGVGYDRATGLGSLNVANLVNKWSSAASGPAITLTPTAITFPGSTTVGVTDATTETVTVKNTGSAVASITGISITGTNLTSFSQTHTCGASLAAAATCTVTVSFKPTVTGANSATLKIADNAGTGSQTATLAGTGATATGAIISLSATSLTFPNTIVATSSVEQTITVTNSGSAVANLSSIAIGGTNPLSWVKLTTCGPTLAVSASCAVYVAFKPASAAALSGVLSITDNASGSPQKVTLSGTGTVAPPIALSVTSLAFPATTHGKTSLAKAVRITNNGTATVHMISITIAGTNPAAFTQVNNCATTLAPAAFCTAFVQFNPGGAGSLSAVLTLTDNGAASPQKVTLTGTGN